jgi:hypothetical protein
MKCSYRRWLFHLSPETGVCSSGSPHFQRLFWNMCSCVWLWHSRFHSQLWEEMVFVTNDTRYDLPHLFLCNVHYCLQTAVDTFEPSYRPSLRLNFYRLIYLWSSINHHIGYAIYIRNLYRNKKPYCSDIIRCLTPTFLSYLQILAYFPHSEK